MAPLVKVWQVGKISYAPALKLQKFLANLHSTKEPTPNTILLVEHPPVFTIGIRTKDYTPSDEARLIQTGAEFYKTNRGGLITFHGPGQLVAYPVINLKHFKLTMRSYVNQIEQTIIELCNRLQLKAEESPHTGVWIGNNKVCAIGVHGSQFITTHGLALNCSTDLSWFEHIVPCGIKNKGVTSLSTELGRCITIEEVIPIFLESFSKVFNCTYNNYPKEQINNILSEIIE